MVVQNDTDQDVGYEISGGDPLGSSGDLTGSLGKKGSSNDRKEVDVPYPTSLVSFSRDGSTVASAWDVPSEATATLTVSSSGGYSVEVDAPSGERAASPGVS